MRFLRLDLFWVIDAFVLITTVVSTEKFLLFGNDSRVLMLIESQTFQRMFSNSIDLSETNQILLSRTGVSHVFLGSCFFVFYIESVVILEKKFDCIFASHNSLQCENGQLGLWMLRFFSSLSFLFYDLNWGHILAFLRSSVKLFTPFWPI